MLPTVTCDQTTPSPICAVGSASALTVDGVPGSGAVSACELGGCQANKAPATSPADASAATHLRQPAANCSEWVVMYPPVLLARRSWRCALTCYGDCIVR